jgi:hypothetical protein
VRIDIILSRSMAIWPSGLTPYVSAHSTAGNELSAGRSRGPRGSAPALSQFLYLATARRLRSRGRNKAGWAGREVG